MIISASRRTDIPAFYGEWFMNRLEEQYVLARNPVNPKQISRLSLAPGDVDCIVFWTKNPKNFLKYIDRIDELKFRYYFQFSLNPYGGDLEPGLPEKAELLETFILLSERIGMEKTIWRCDPIIINDNYSLEYHKTSFNFFCEKLRGHTEKCVISFVDNYPFLKNEFQDYGILGPSAGQIEELIKSFSASANQQGIALATCAEKINLPGYGVLPNRCIDTELMERLFNIDIRYRKDPSQRSECGCSISRDIGAYNTCLYNCIYCYAKHGKKVQVHDPSSPLLCDTQD